MSPRYSIAMRSVLIVSLAALPGCRDRHVRVREHREVIIERAEFCPPPPPVVVVEPPPPVGEVIVVQQAPPPVIVEPCPPPPAVGMIWVQGSWVHRHGHYTWSRGRYVRPVPNHRFEPARWEHSRRGWEFHRERWAPEPGPRGRGDRGNHGDRGGSHGRINPRDRGGPRR